MGGGGGGLEILRSDNDSNKEGKITYSVRNPSILVKSYSYNVFIWYCHLLNRGLLIMLN